LTDRAKALRPIIQAAFDSGGLDAICELFARLEAKLEDQAAEFAAHTAKLEARIMELEKRLNKNSSNSSKPPSSDGLKRKPKSLRPKNTGRKPSGQPGHPGQTLRQSEAPDIVVEIPLVICPHCSGDLKEEPVASVEKRQVFDLPPIKIQVTEYQAERKVCPHCGRLLTAAFPSGVSAPAQYGPAVQAAMAYLNVRHVIPCLRTVEIFQDLFGHRPSAGSVVLAAAQCAARLAPAVEEIRNHLTATKLLHADETGVRCEGKTQWLHVVSDATHTLYTYSDKRGTEGIAAGQVLPNYQGILVHDFWAAYDKLDCQHARCNAHLLRELTACVESGHLWAQGIISALLAMKKAADHARAKNEKTIPAAHRKRFQNEYDKWVEIGLQAHPEKNRIPGIHAEIGESAKSSKRGRVKQSVETNLLKRLRDKRDEVLRFAEDLEVPFDNNQAERDLRMIKVQQKVSGCFRSEEGAKRFCVISSYLSTIRKQGLNLMDSIKTAFAGNPVALTS
jgi:transposase